jgi:transposase InsO family protein
LERAIDWFADHGVRVKRVMTDNGTGYRSKVHAAAIAHLWIKHLIARPYRPRTNGKAERVIQTTLRECAYGQPFSTSAQRRRSLRRWVTRDDTRRPHSALDRRTPISRQAQAA